MINRWQFHLASLLASLAAMTPLAGFTADSKATARPAPVSTPLAWPSNWTVNERERAGYALVVTQPGAIVVNVQAQGAPVKVTLSSDGGPTIERAGSGAIRLDHQVSAGDVQRSPLWRLNISLAQPKGNAAGTVSVQQPPPDARVLKQVSDAVANDRSTKLRAQAAVAVRPDTNAAMGPRRAQFEQQQKARRDALFAAIQQRLAPGLVSSQALSASPTGVTTRATPPPKVSPSPVSKIPRPPPAFVQAPVIASVSNAQGLAEGQPGDPIVISGTSFGGLPPTDYARGIFNGYWVELQLSGAPATINNPRYVPFLGWSDTQILITLDWLTGFAAPLSGQIIVHRGDGYVSAPAAFTLRPTMTLVSMQLPPRLVDSSVHFPDSYYTTPGNVSALPTDSGTPDGWNSQIDTYSGWGVSTGLAGWFGDKGYDEFYMTTQLAPGFSVYSADVTVLNVWTFGLFNGAIRLAGTDSQAMNHAWAYVAETGSPTRPYLKIRTWQNPMTSIDYTIRVLILGPAGVSPFQ